MQMKNKILASLTALCAALVLVGGFSVTAYAQTPTEETDDSGVIVETEPQPLTPEGNMTLVDDIDGDYRGGTDRAAPGCLQLYREMQGGRSKHRLPRLLCQHG